MRRWVLAVVLTMACGSLPAHAQTLALAYKAGDTYHYTLKMSSNEAFGAGAVAVPSLIHLTADETLTVKSIDSTGVADVTVAFTNVTMTTTTTAGSTKSTNTISGLPFPKQDLKIASDGRIISLNGTSLSNFMASSLFGQGYFISAVLPDTAVRPGDTWSKSYDQTVPAGTGTIHVTTISTYLRDETVKSVSTAVVETKSALSVNFTIDLSKMLQAPPLGVAASPTPGSTMAPMLPSIGSATITVTGTASTDVTSWIDPGSHRIVRSRMSGENDLTISFALTPSASPAPEPPMAPAGPLSMKGNQSLDLEPA